MMLINADFRFDTAEKRITEIFDEVSIGKVPKEKMEKPREDGKATRRYRVRRGGPLPVN